MQQQRSFGAIAVHLQQYRSFTVTTRSIINEQRFLIMDNLYLHVCVFLFAGRYGSLHGNKDAAATLTDVATEKGKITENNNYANVRWNNYGRIHYL